MRKLFVVVLGAALILVTRDLQARYQAYDEHSTLLRLEA